MSIKTEQFRVTVKYPWIDGIWRLAIGVGQQWVEIPIDSDQAILAQLKRFCLRIAYAHGLDKGCLICVNRENGRFIASKIVPVAISFLNPFVETKKTFLIGADPEFVLTRLNQPLIADRYLPRHSEIGNDYVRITSTTRIPALVEMRPAPAKDAEQLGMHLNRLITELDDYIYDSHIHFVAGSMPFPGLSLGGHLHFSGVPCEVDLIRCLDNYLALPLSLMENPTDLKHRRPKYGLLGDIRFQPHGGFEYRTLPSWLESPVITFGVLAMAVCVVQNVHLFPLRLLSDFKIQNAFYNMDFIVLKEATQLIWQDLFSKRALIHNFPLIDQLFKRVFVQHPWSKSDDFRTNWRLMINEKMI